MPSSGMTMAQEVQGKLRAANHALELARRHPNHQATQTMEALDATLEAVALLAAAMDRLEIR